MDLALVSGAAGLALGVLAWLLLRALARVVRRRHMRARAERASDGERRAVLLLEQSGYEVIGMQVPARYELTVDGEAQSFDVRVDYVARRSGRRFVAEVKTGALAPRLDTPATRRQLLEYALAYRAHGVLLVDAEANVVRAVELPSWTTSTVSRTYVSLPLLFVACAALGAVASSFVLER